MDYDDLDQLLIDKGKMIFRYLMKLGVSRVDAEDIVQETLVKALQVLDDIAVDKFTPWLFRVAFNTHIDHLRKKKRRGELPLESVSLITQQTLDDAVLTRELQDEIQSVFDSLHPAYSHMLLLKYEYGLSHREIATVLGLKEENVKVSMFRARNRFREAYGRLNHERT
ncbi:RNA polymerase sigma-70 factor (ECF subfamily) [Tumebacillus sp. BK434]|uniref:RNA polymerase sigma factor n=1 Tax=Tumebacillus sp. BK434 TaxID=2512169 RepID=UPI00104993E2|nr:RNA polymerase sigma factor [Tumebacillus sp. BK434]TCP52691.1 RNA polymerase sigma-70 factor (ECF subfamily) [Tumebacillus sp. BK434]